MKNGIHAVFDFFRIFNDLLRNDRLRDNSSDFPARIETRVRILENHLDLAAHELLVFSSGSVQIFSIHFDRAGRRFIQTYQHSGSGGLSAPGLSYQCQSLASTNLKRNTVDSFQQRPRLSLDHSSEQRRRHIKIFLQILHLDQYGLSALYVIVQHFGMSSGALMVKGSCGNRICLLRRPAFQQATSLLPQGCSPGRSRMHFSSAKGQRG